MKRTLEEREVSISQKRARDEDTGTASDADEFFALLNRIKETEKQFGVVRRVSKGKIASVSLECFPEGSDKQAIRPRAVWRPSFAWEDFSGSGNGTGTANGSLCSAFLNSNKRNLPEIVNNNRNCMQSLRADQDYENSRERLDLNLPLTPAGL